jgi:hypothetical protein
MSKNSLPVICSAVRQNVVETLETVIAQMKYKPFKTPLFLTEQPFNLAFTCCLDDSHSNHFMIVDNKNQYCVKCLKNQVAFRVPKDYLLWFDQVATKLTHTMPDQSI